MALSVEVSIQALNCQLKRRDKVQNERKWAKSEKVMEWRDISKEKGTRTIQHPVEKSS